MTHQNCSFHGGPANGTRHMVDDATGRVSFSPAGPPIGITDKPDAARELRPPIHTYARSEVSPSRFIYQGEDGKLHRPIRFTQYLRPDGRRSAVEIDVPHDVAEKVDRLHARHLVLECEVLTTGEVSLTITDQEEETDVDIRLVPNGPAVPEAVYDLVREFDLEGYRR